MAAPQDADAIARALLGARHAASGLSAYPGTLPTTLAQGYAIQNAAMAAHGEDVAGWKVGRILPPLSDHYGADRLAGPIFIDTVKQADDTAKGYIFAEGFGAAEAEFLLRIGTMPAFGKTAFTLEEAAAHIDAVHIGIEIASSPFVGINENGPAVTVSDFGNNNGLLIGPAIPDWRNSDFADTDVSVFIDGAVIGTGRASNFPDGVIGSARFLLQNLAERGIALPAGSWISSGAVSGVHRVKVGQRVIADFRRFGSLSCTIEAQIPR